MTKFTGKQIVEAAKSALSNWDFDVYLENGESIEQVTARKKSLTFDEFYANDNWPDGLECKDIFDYLEERSTNISEL